MRIKKLSLIAPPYVTAEIELDNVLIQCTRMPSEMTHERDAEDRPNHSVQLHL